MKKEAATVRETLFTNGSTASTSSMAASGVNWSLSATTSGASAPGKPWIRPAPA